MHWPRWVQSSTAGSAAANGSRARGPCNRSGLPVASPGYKQRGELRDDADPAALASAMLGAI